MDEIRISCRIKGSRPLLMNAFTGSGDDGPAKKGRIYNDEDEARKRLYLDPEGRVCQPATHLEASMVKSAGDFKFVGRKTYRDIFKSGIFVEPDLIPHVKAGWSIDKQSVVVQKARILRCRPRFDDWEPLFRVIVRDDQVEPLIVKDILENAGKYVGIGDYRPRFGLFTVESFEAPER
jgi:hypothetical protein